MRPYPESSIEAFPSPMQENPDAGTLALAAKLDTMLKGIFDDVDFIELLKLPEACPQQFLEEFGYMLQAGILPGDDDRTRRVKISTAVAGHKLRGTWVHDVKPKIDSITGASATLWNPIGRELDWPVRIGGDPAPHAWMVRGGGLDAYGIIRTGTGCEVIIEGYVYIDVGTPGLTPEQVRLIVDTLRVDVAPAYFHIYVGYISTGKFIVYSGGIIE
jgi:hypothetical protein